MRLRRPRIVAVAILAAVAFPIVPATAAVTTKPTSGLGIQLLDAPVSEKNDPRAHAYIIDQLRPGVTITRHVRVTNNSRRAAHASVYAAAASIGGGHFHFADGHTGNDLTSWTSVSPSNATLAGGDKTDVTVRIAVPKNATRGERYAVIWAEISSAPTANGVRQINRVGVRIYLDVSGTNQPTEFAIGTLTGTRSPTGQPVVTARVHNTGRRAIDVSGTVALTHGPAALLTNRVPVDPIVTIGPGGTQNVSATFGSKLPAGPWLVTVSLASGTTHHTASATMTFPAVAAAPVVGQAEAQQPSSSSKPWWLIGPIFAILALIVMIWQLRRRRQAAATEESTS